MLGLLSLAIRYLKLLGSFKSGRPLYNIPLESTYKAYFRLKLSFLSIREIAKLEAPIPLNTILISFFFFPTIFNAFISAARVTQAVTC
jgi:hypothetical protein